MVMYRWDGTASPRLLNSPVHTAVHFICSAIPLCLTKSHIPYAPSHTMFALSNRSVAVILALVATESQNGLYWKGPLDVI